MEQAMQLCTPYVVHASNVADGGRIVCPEGLGSIIAAGYGRAVDGMVLIFCLSLLLAAALLAVGYVRTRREAERVRTVAVRRATRL